MNAPRPVSALFGGDAARCSLENGRSALIWTKMVADTETPVSAALKLIQPGRGDWVLESVEGGETRGRYSLIGLNPDLVFRAHRQHAEINRNWHFDKQAFAAIDGNPLDALANLVAECHADFPPELPPALACLVGYCGYETIGLIENLPRPPENPIDLPDIMFVRPTILLVFDRLADQLYIIAPIWFAPDANVALQIGKAQDKIDSIAAIMAQPLPRMHDMTQLIETDVDVRPAIAPESYGNMVRRAKEYILAGDIFQVVLAQRFSVSFTLPPFALYRALRRINPSPFLYFLDFPGFALIGSSPEILVRLRDEEITIRPIAGTRPRGKTAAEDQANKLSLLADPKECAEHLMLLDLGRNDVGRVAQAGSVRVTDSYMVEFYSHVMHIVSNVTGKIAAGKTALQALFAGFPAGTVSGAPKVRACEIIAELEPETRGAYGGGVGYFSPDGSMDSCIVLRTAVVKDGVMHVQAGAGIVADSDPAYEQRECEAKAGALIAAARDAIATANSSNYGQ